MFIKRASVAGLVLSAAFLAAGCGTESGIADEGSEVVETGLAKDDAKRPLGTYVPQVPGAGPFNKLTLSANLTYEAEQKVECFVAPCPALEVSGDYHYSHAGSIRYLTFTGQYSAKFAYELQGDVLRLRAVGTKIWTSLSHDTQTVPAYCGGMGETRPRGGCPVGYSCNCPNGAACFVAGTCSPDPKPVTCGIKTCAAGQVCCNPLMGICTAPGEFCTL
jgi:hypothetical protein